MAYFHAPFYFSVKSIFHYHWVFLAFDIEKLNRVPSSIIYFHFSFNSFLASFVTMHFFGRKTMESVSNCRTVAISMGCTAHHCIVIPLLGFCGVGLVWFFQFVFASGTTGNFFSLG